MVDPARYTGVMTPLEITVRGRAERRYPPERATLHLQTTFNDLDSATAHGKAVQLQSEISAELRRLVEAGAATTWHSDNIHVYGQRPWVNGVESPQIVFTTSISISVEFVDFDALATFLTDWAGREGVQVGSISWDVTAENRRLYEDDVRREAVGDAIRKADSYADACRRGPVAVVALADPDMLGSGPPDAPAPMMARAMYDSAGSGSLELRADDVVVAAAVDARFQETSKRGVVDE